MGKPTFEMLWARCLAKKPRSWTMTLAQTLPGEVVVVLGRAEVSGPRNELHFQPMISYRDEPIRALEKLEHWIDRWSSPTSQ